MYPALSTTSHSRPTYSFSLTSGHIIHNLTLMFPLQPLNAMRPEAIWTMNPLILPNHPGKTTPPGHSRLCQRWGVWGRMPAPADHHHEQHHPHTYISANLPTRGSVVVIQQPWELQQVMPKA